MVVENRDSILVLSLSIFVCQKLREYPFIPIFLHARVWVKPNASIAVGRNRMEIKQIAADTYTTLIPVGELDASSSVYLDEVIRELIDGGIYNLHVDFGETGYISSAGMGVFISYIEEIQQNQGKMVLSNMSESVKDSFELLGLNQLITIVAGTEEVEKLYT